MSRNIVICFDGTGNEYGEMNTNVVHTFEAIERDGQQVAFYDPGVGTLREVIRRDPGRVGVVPVSDPWILRDLDRPEDLQAARAALDSPSAGP